MIKKTLFISIFVLGTFAHSQINYSWRYYTPGNTGIQGDYAEGLWIDHDGNPYIAAYVPFWEEGGFAKYIQSENRWINYSNVDYPVIGNINDVGASRISDIVEDSNNILWMAHWRGILKFNPSIGPTSLEFYGSNNSPHPGGRTTDLVVAPDGSIWATVVSVVWGNGGLINYDPATNIWRYWTYGSTANNWPSTVPYSEYVSIQQKNSGGYFVWISAVGGIIRFDSDTQLFTYFPFNYNPGDLIQLPGGDCSDELNNLWIVRFSTSVPGTYSLDYITMNGNWITPPQPPVASVLNDIWAFKAYGNGKALLIDGNSTVWQFTGSSWQNLGSWKQGAYSYGVDIDNNGNIWVTGTEGAAKRDAQTGTWQRYRITNSSQIDYFVRDITIDNDGNIWMTGNAGPGYGGFQKFDGTRWTGFNQYTYGLGYPFPFSTDNVDEICYRPSNGHIVINPMFQNLYAWNGSNYISLNYPHSKSKGLVEDSQNRLWSLGEYFNLKYYNDVTNSWTSVPFDGWGANIAKDPTRPGTIWACSGNQVIRTDGSYIFTKYNTDFPELNPQSDLLTTVAPAPDGIAWVGSSKGLFKLNANNGTYQFFSPQNSQIPGEYISPLIVTDDGRIWFSNFGSGTTSTYGLCWYDGTNFGIIPQQQTGGLPHAQIYDIEVKYIPNGYELWISCASRGIAVLTVTGTIIPVELTSFTASVNGNSVILNWSTATETNNFGFAVERKQVYSSQSSVSNAEWKTVGFIYGNGTTTERQSYSFIDNNLTSGKSDLLTGRYLYRLKQIDYDGAITYSNEVEVTINAPEKFELSQNYPNPFNPITKIKYTIPSSVILSSSKDDGTKVTLRQAQSDIYTTLKVYDVIGNEVATLVDEYKEAGSYEISFDGSFLSSGVYFYKLEVKEDKSLYTEIKKMILMK